MIEKTHSINDVAKMAGVSPATVSNVLTGRKPVSAKLVKKVEAAVKALDYRADPLASMLRSGEAKIIAVLVPDLDNPFFTSVVSAVEQCLGQEAYEVIVASSHGEELVERSRLKAILAWRPAGLIVIPCSDEFPGRELIESSETPYVIADRVTGNLERRHRLGRQRRRRRHWRSPSDRPRPQRYPHRGVIAEPRQHSATLQRRQPRSCGRMVCRSRRSSNSASRSTRRPQGSRIGSMRIRRRPRFRR